MKKSNCTGFANAKKQPLRNHEDILVFYGKQCTYNPQGLRVLAKPMKRSAKVGSFMRTGFRDDYCSTMTGYPKSVLHFTSAKKTVHPTQKPVALMEYLIRTYTNPGDVVLDNCMGSGTTGVASLTTGRSFIGVERDPNYFATAKERISRGEEVRVCPFHLDFS